MRVSAPRRKVRIARIWSRILAVMALWAVATPSRAGELVQTLPHLWVSAAALSVALVTAASRPRD